MMADGWRHVATFCGTCDCGCPKVYLAGQALAERRVVITDDFEQRVEMSLEAFAVAGPKAVGDLADDRMRETSPHLLGVLIHPGVEPHSRPPVRFRRRHSSSALLCRRVSLIVLCGWWLCFWCDS
ncbi:hypothetical protein [Actinophytocola sp.]|uniref:hypothetical protein n=1 Tax=Actinophytocola sp. TaxID=1872138 RepID=UPI003D6A68B3